MFVFKVAKKRSSTADASKNIRHKKYLKKIEAFNDTATNTFRLILKFLAPLITSLRGVGTRDIIFLVASTIPREERSMVY